MRISLDSLPLLVAASLFADNVAAFWRINCANIQRGRIDPIVNFGGISAHVHTVQGGANFGVSATNDTLANSACTSCEVQDDKSAYWTPLLYYQFANGSFIDVKQTGSVLYYIGRGVNNKNIVPFPPGFRMISGDAAARSFDDKTMTFGNKSYGSRPVAERINFACLTTKPGSTTNGLNNTDCAYGLRAQVHFQSCWDGVNLYKSDQSHVAYMSDIDNGVCPPTHPVQFIHLFIETSYQVNKVAKEDGGRFVFSTGDTTGYSFHADFQNGWKQDTLSRAVAACATNPGSSGDLNECPPLMESKIDNYPSLCPERKSQVDEQVTGLLPNLPGCINVLSGPTRATFSDMNCDASVTRPDIIPTQDTVPLSINLPTIGEEFGNDDWVYSGCANDTQSGRVMSAASMSAANMTVPICQNYCQSKGYKFAGLEMGTQCFCDNFLFNNPVFNTGTVNQGKCYQLCGGDGNSYCGGAGRIDIYNLTTAEQLPLPSIQDKSGTYVYKGCYKEPTRARLFKDYSTSGNTMTVDSCAKFCLGKNLKWFGVEYGRECYCGSGLNLTLPGASLAPDDDCDMPCAGNSGQSQFFCGAGSRLASYYSGTL